MSHSQSFLMTFALVGLAFHGQQAATAERTMVYLSAGGDNRVLLMELNPQTGALEPRGQLDLEGAPGAMTNDPKRKTLYVSVRNKNSVAALAAPLGA